MNKLHCAVLPGPTQSSPQQLFVGSHAPSTTSSANVSRETRAAPVSQPPPTFVRHSGSSRGSGAVTCWPAACGGLSATRAAAAASLGRMVLKPQQPGARQRLAGGAPLVRSIGRCDAAPPARPGCREFCSLCTSAALAPCHATHTRFPPHSCGPRGGSFPAKGRDTAAAASQPPSGLTQQIASSVVGLAAFEAVTSCPAMSFVLSPSKQN